MLKHQTNTQLIYCKSMNYNLFSEHYLYYFLQSPTFKQVFNTNKNGIIGGVSINNLKTLILPIPPKQEQDRIVSKLKQILPKLDTLK